MKNNSVLGLFGQLADGRMVYSYTLRNARGSELTIMNYGATILNLKVHGKSGLTDVVLGFDTIEDYIYSHDLPAPPYFGAIAGRFSGRIDKGKFSIDGVSHQTSLNNNGNTLHGGTAGFDRRLWRFVSVSPNSAELEYVSADAEEGFPGELTVKVSYSISDEDKVTISYTAATTAATVINLTQHAYFNLDGHTEDLSGQELFIDSKSLLEADDELIPTGRLIPASDKRYDFTEPGKCPKGIDDSFVIENPSKPAATLTSRQNGLRLTVESDQESLHIYVGGNCFGQVRGKEGADYHDYSGICFESQNYPDAPNKPHFPNSVLRPQETYTQTTHWTFERI